MGEEDTVSPNDSSAAGARPATRAAPRDEAGAAGAASEACPSQPVTLGEIKSGRVRPGVSVAVTDLLASSQKFLLSEAKSGSCLWGAFAAGAGLSGAGSGLLLVSFGAPHAEAEPCAPGSDGLPDDLAVGDELSATGVLDEFAPSACQDVALSQQLRIDATCPLQRQGHGDPPQPTRIDLALADRLAAGGDAELLRAWGGALVTLEDVEALQDPDDGDAVLPFGVIRLRQTELEAHSRLYYFDLRDGGPKATGKAPAFRYPTEFARLTGVVFLDYCSWSLAPRDRCSDSSPASVGCPSAP